MTSREQFPELVFADFAENLQIDAAE